MPSKTYGDHAKAGEDPLRRRDWAPTARLRFVMRTPVAVSKSQQKRFDVAGPISMRVLQQWYAPDIEEYMRGKEGEWRDVVVEEEK